jgi:hypothetical protein
MKAIDYLTLKSKGYKFLYLDESAINEQLYPHYGYSKKGSPYIITSPP